ncbi:unnamed protein product [Oikopleura dioica]|uniref:Uncharacterized protein n=1 Tax=Oikopleura dioica TaxID=34765 RepID=E4X6I4_OIKDI|nr:unnamed protein product [Oikopleura dioica]
MSTEKPIKRIPIRKHTDLPADCIGTPGGTIYGTTPGGTKIIYDRLYLLRIRDHVVSQTPPRGMPNIPGVTCIESIVCATADNAEHGRSEKTSTNETIDETPEDNLKNEFPDELEL